MDKLWDLADEAKSYVIENSKVLLLLFIVSILWYTLLCTKHSFPSQQQQQQTTTLLVHRQRKGIEDGDSSVCSSSSSHRDEEAEPPPHIPYRIPFLGSASEFQANCRTFVQTNLNLYQTPIVSALIAGRTYHFVTSTGHYPLERIFRQRQMSFRPVANDALQFGFGFQPQIVQLGNGGGPNNGGDAQEVNKIFHQFMLNKKDELENMTACAQMLMRKEILPKILKDICVTGGQDKENNTTKVMVTTTMGLYELVSKVLYKATVGSAVSSSVMDDTCLEKFKAFDSKIAMLIGALPDFFFPSARKGREQMVKLMQTDDVIRNESRMLQKRREVLQSLGITNRADLARYQFVVLWASVANTIPAGFWLLFHLLQEKETAYEAVRNEVLSVISKRNVENGNGNKKITNPHDRPFSIEELESMVCLDSALTEALRLYSESIIARDVVQDFDFDLHIPGTPKYRLKKGSRVAVLVSLLHYDEEVFVDPKTFKWDRFLPDKVTGEKPTFQKHGRVLTHPVRPFGGGSSMCPGRKFACNEIKAFVATLVSQFDLRLVPNAVDGSKPPVPRYGQDRVGLGINVPLNDVQIEIRRL